MAEQVQKMFFSKDSISELNKIVLQQTNCQHLSKEGKAEIINILVKNMKGIFKAINIDQINNSNVKQVFDQFKTHSLRETITDIKKSGIINSQGQSAADLKFNRDFKSAQTPGNKVQDRPEFTKAHSQLPLNDRIKSAEQRRQQPEQLGGFSSGMNTYESNLDSAFRPIVDSLSDMDRFNSYDSGKNLEDINSRMSDIKQSRESEVIIKNQRPTTPDFLKPRKTSIRSDDNNMGDRPQSSTQQFNKNDPRQQFEDMKRNNQQYNNVEPSQFDNGFNGLANSSGDLYSFDNIDMPLIDREIEEDNLPFDERLKRLTSERENIEPISQSGKIDFTSENYPRGDTNVVPTSRSQQSRSDTSKQQEMLKYQQMKEQQIRDQRQREREQEMIRQQQLREQEIKSQHNDSRQQYDSLKSSMKNIGVEIREDTNKIREMKELIDKLSYENRELKQLTDDLREQLNKPSEMDKIIEVKQQIAKEFESLNNKNEEINSKLSELNLKELDIIKKDSELKQLISNHEYLFKSSHLQVEITDPENKSNYSWSMMPIDNVIGIKLMSYSLPLPRFNITEGKNNILTLKINGETVKLELTSGKYNIEDIISILNSKISEQNKNISIQLNPDQRIIIESSDENDIIEIIPTILSKENLGFVLSATESHKHISDKIWDLRIDDRIYIYLNNLSSETPFGILYFNGQSVSQFKFQKPFNLSKLDIVFKDTYGMEYNFHNLPHNLSFLIEKV